MFLNRPLVLTAMLALAGAAIRSQDANSDEAANVRPAPIFADAPADAAAPQLNVAPNAPNAASPFELPAPASAPRPPIQANATAPWDFSLPKPAADAPDGDPGSKSREGEIDLTALRYFAGQGDLARVAAEIRRLREKHPGWEPPQDLFGQSGNSEFEKPLWDLFAQHDYDGVRAGVEAIQDKNPGWQPSSDLISKLTLAEANDKLVKASDAQQWGDVIDIAAANKMLLTCGDVDAIWRTAEALARTDDEPRALEAYRYILATCPKREERLATIQKASQILKSPEDLEALLRLGKRLPNGTSEFESIRLDLIRQKVGDAAAGKAGPEASQTEIDALAAHARNANDRGDQQLLGWLAYSRKDYAQAESWFTMALRPGPDPKAAEGLVLTLRGAGRIADAQKLAVQYAGLGPLNRKLMIEVLTASLNDPAATPLSPEDLVTLSQAIDLAKSSDGAQLYAWRLYNANDIAGAADWFRKSADWQQNESAAIGLIITARRLHNMHDYADFVAKYRDVYPKVAALDAAMGGARNGPAAHAQSSGTARSVVAGGGWDKNADAIAKAMQAGDVTQALAMLDERKSKGLAEPSGLTVIRGWALYQKGDWEGAKKVFASLQANQEQVEDAEFGLATIEHAELPPASRR
jgi:tetratricopeptide (TPR) repeat protein